MTSSASSSTAENLLGRLSGLCSEDRAKVAQLIKQVASYGGEAGNLRSELYCLKQANEERKRELYTTAHERDSMQSEVARLRAKLADSLALLHAYQNFIERTPKCRSVSVLGQPDCMDAAQQTEDSSQLKCRMDPDPATPVATTELFKASPISITTVHQDENIWSTQDPTSEFMLSQRHEELQPCCRSQSMLMPTLSQKYTSESQLSFCDSIPIGFCVDSSASEEYAPILGTPKPRILRFDPSLGENGAFYFVDIADNEMASDTSKTKIQQSPSALVYHDEAELNPGSVNDSISRADAWQPESSRSPKAGHSHVGNVSLLRNSSCDNCHPDTLNSFPQPKPSQTTVSLSDGMKQLLKDPQQGFTLGMATSGVHDCTTSLTESRNWANNIFPPSSFSDTEVGGMHIATEDGGKVEARSRTNGLPLEHKCFLSPSHVNDCCNQPVTHKTGAQLDVKTWPDSPRQGEGQGVNAPLSEVKAMIQDSSCDLDQLHLSLSTMEDRVENQPKRLSTAATEHWDFGDSLLELISAAESMQLGTPDMGTDALTPAIVCASWSSKSFPQGCACPVGSISGEKTNIVLSWETPKLGQGLALLDDVMYEENDIISSIIDVEEMAGVNRC